MWRDGEGDIAEDGEADVDAAPHMRMITLLKLMLMLARGKMFAYLGCIWGPPRGTWREIIDLCI